MELGIKEELHETPPPDDDDDETAPEDTQGRRKRVKRGTAVFPNTCFTLSEQELVPAKRGTAVFPTTFFSFSASS